MEAFDAFQMFQAVKLHFSGNYDYFKYQGRVNTKRDTFESRNDKYHFHKLSKKDDLEFFLAVNLYHNPKVWVGELFTEECDKRYKEALKRRQSLSYAFKEEMSLFDSLDDALVPPNHEYPKIVKMHLQNRISPETMIILNLTCHVFDYWSNSLDDPVIWPELRNKLDKLAGFIGVDVAKFRKILLDIQS